MHQLPHIACIALGSNLGDRAQNISNALDQLNAIDGIHVLKRSSLLENPAVGGPADSPPFLNAAAVLETTLNARELLGKLLDVEQSLGRHRSGKWGPRTIDLDILLFDDQVIQEEGLTIPHPLMHLRDFVLKPLAEIAGDVVHPVVGRTITQILSGGLRF